MDGSGSSSNDGSGSRDLGSLAHGLAARGLSAGDAGDPGFSVDAADAWSRLADDVVVAAQALMMAGPDLLPPRTDARVVVLGAGPGAALLALAQVLPHLAPQLERVEVVLVDRAPSWTAARSGVHELARTLWPGRLQVTDLVVGTGRIDPGPVVDAVRPADVVLAVGARRDLRDEAGLAPLLALAASALGATAGMLITATGDEDAGRPLETPKAAEITLLQRSVLELPAPARTPDLVAALARTAPTPVAAQRLRAEVLLMGSTLTPLRPSGFDPTADQAEALSDFRDFLTSDDRVFLLRGPAGTGKTALFRPLIALARSAGLGAVLMAPTGAAAQRLHARTGQKGSTVHSTIYAFDRVREVRLSEQPTLDDELAAAERSEDLTETVAATADGDEADTDDLLPVTTFRRGEPPPEPLLYVVDESSLIGDAERDDSEVVEVEFAEGRVLSDLLWFALRADGSRVVLAGDQRQLPPVDDPEAPALKAETYRSRGIGVVTADLRDNVRHRAAPAIGRVSDRLIEALDGRAANRDLDLIIGEESDGGISRRTGDPFEDGELLAEAAALRTTIVTSRNVDVARWNRSVRERLGRPHDRPAPGDHLLIVRTDHPHALHNGEAVQIVAVDDAPERVRIRRETVTLWPVRFQLEQPGGLRIEHELLVVGETLEQPGRPELLRATRVLTADFFRRHPGLRPTDPRYRKLVDEDERLNALRAQYAYARTAHRAQGGEWDRVVVDRSRMPAVDLRWFYTALTRARREAILLDPSDPARSVDLGEAPATIAEALTEAGLRLADHRPIQDALQLTIASASDPTVTCRLNVYWRGGRPSRVVATGHDPGGLGVHAKRTVEAWVDRTVAAASPVSADVVETVARLRTACGAAGIVLETHGRGPYLVAMVAHRGDVLCRTEWHHDARGRFTKQSPNGTAGDPALLSDLTGIIRGIA